MNPEDLMKNLDFIDKDEELHDTYDYSLLSIDDKILLVIDICNKYFLEPWEGTGPMDDKGNFVAYLDPVGIPTVAWGFTYDENDEPITMGQVWSMDRAVKHKKFIIRRYLNSLYKASPVIKYHHPVRIAAVLSWVYNLGLGSYRNSTFKKRIDKENWSSAYYECLRWNKAKGKVLRGLTRRRKFEGIAIYTSRIPKIDMIE